MELLPALLGLVIVALVMWDVAMTVLHPDAEGSSAKLVRRCVWWLATTLGARRPAARRRVLGLAGPFIVAVTFMSWVVALIVGFSLIVWPMLGDFSAHPGLGALGFADALYYAGSTVTVLGHGDITPRTASGQLVTVAGSGLGFTVFTSMAAYLIEIVNGVSVRNRFALAIHDDFRGRGGTARFGEFLAVETPSEVRTRCQGWAENLRAVDEMVHRYPLVAFTYRSHRDEYDPEPAIRQVAESTVAAIVASEIEPGLRTTAEELTSALTRLQRTISDRYLSADIVQELKAPRPGPLDRRAVDHVAAVLGEHLGKTVDHGSVDGPAADAIRRSRVFLAGLQQWTRTDIEPHDFET